MITAIKVRTPKGMADRTNRQLKRFVVGRSKYIQKVLISPDDDEFTWIIECDLKSYIRISRNVAMFDTFVRGTFDHKLTKKAVKRYISKEQQEELMDMLQNHTTVELIKNPSVEEIEKAYNTLWSRIKGRLVNQDNR